MAAVAGKPAAPALSEASMSELENLPPGKKSRQEPKLLVKRLSEHAYLPRRGSAGAAGYDLARCMPVLLKWVYAFKLALQQV